MELINIITPAIQKRKIDNETFLDFFSQFFGIIGILVYIEFIELNFCDLNYNLRRKITERSDNEIKSSIQDYDINSDISSIQSDD